MWPSSSVYVVFHVELGFAVKSETKDVAALVSAEILHRSSMAEYIEPVCLFKIIIGDDLITAVDYQSDLPVSIKGKTRNSFGVNQGE